MRKLRTAAFAGLAAVRRAMPHRLQDLLSNLPTSRTESTPALCAARGWPCHALAAGGNRPVIPIEGTSPGFARAFREAATVLPSWPQFVAEIPGGRVLGGACTAIAPGGIVLADASPHNWVPPHHHRALANAAWAPPPRHLPGTTALVGASGRSNYYHWTFDMIPRIELILSAVPADRIDRWLLPRTRLGAATELLSRCGVDPATVHWHGRGAQVECERLVVSGPPAPLGGPTARSVEFLRSRCVPGGAPAAAGGRRLMLLRRGTRKIANMADLEPVLRAHGIEAVATEGMGFAEQVRMFSGASLLVGVHGAGLTNAVFMPPGSALVEVMTPWYLASCYLVLAGEADLRYRAVEAGRAGGSGGDPHQDVTVDPAALDAQVRAVT
jgi:hypothetical protein